MRRWPAALLLVGLLGCMDGPAATVLSAKEVGTVTQSPLITGRDGAESGVIFGQDIWAFGDTFLSVPNAQGMGLVSNTFATCPGLTDGGLVLTDWLDDAGSPAQLLQPTADEEAYDLAHQLLPDGGCLETPCGARYATWPGALVYQADAGTGLVFYFLETAAPGDFNFQQLGQSIAVWDSLSSLPTRPTPEQCGESPTLLFCKDEPGFGAAAVVVGSDLFAFGCVPDGLGFDCELGKVPYLNALEKSAWLFWTGSGWSASLRQAATLFSGASILGVFLDAYLDMWVVVYSSPLSNQVVFRTAPNVTGPWSGEGNLFIANHGNQPGWTYDALPHPELSEQNGKVFYVTYSRPTSEFGSEFALVRIEIQ